MPARVVTRWLCSADSRQSCRQRLSALRMAFQFGRLASKSCVLSATGRRRNMWALLLRRGSLGSMFAVAYRGDGRRRGCGGRGRGAC
eukprot:2561751-Pyramimonas_sp.AAC.1